MERKIEIVELKRRIHVTLYETSAPEGTSLEQWFQDATYVRMVHQHLGSVDRYIQENPNLSHLSEPLRQSVFHLISLLGTLPTTLVEWQELRLALEELHAEL